MTQFTTTFVTVLFKIYDIPCVNGKTLEKRLEWFSHLVKTHIPIYLFVDEANEPTIRRLFGSYPNLFIKLVPDFKSTWTYGVFDAFRDNLPSERTAQKDTFEYLTLMNTKTELVKKAALEDVFHTKQYAWVDFNIFHVIKNIEEASFNFRKLAYRTLAPGKNIVIPGCWNAGMVQEKLWASINWRFCGTFHMGTREGVLAMQEHIESNLLPMLTRRGGITWEVNLWSEMENTTDWRPCWYKADHNDSLIKIPDSFFSFM
jgi:hypothetical protein